MMISIPPKYAVSQVIGFIKGKSAIYPTASIAKETQFCGAAFLAEGILRLDGNVRDLTRWGAHQ
jgi:putative transposase